MNFGDANTPDPLERALQASLRPVDPGADFTAALLGRLRPVQRPWHTASLALAASVVMALAMGWQLLEVQQAQQAQQARIQTQLLLALEITSERLGLAQQRIEQYQLQENHP
jgi:hypothetical protein